MVNPTVFQTLRVAPNIVKTSAALCSRVWKKKKNLLPVISTIMVYYWGILIFIIGAFTNRLSTFD